MDKYSISIEAIIMIASLCTSIGAIWAFAKKITKPYTDLIDRVETLEERTTKCENYLNHDDQAFTEQQEINKLILKSNHALLSHALDGNNTKEMEVCKDEIQERLFNTGGKIK